MATYTIGLDFGTLSGRAVLVDVATGKELADSEHSYTHGVMESHLPDGTPLGEDWALQHPQDYLDVLAVTIPTVLKKSGVSAEDVIGIGTDFTSCTILPIKANGTPLCLLEEYQNKPHAFVKLWKHHAAQEDANRLNDLAHQRGEKWISRYGGKISSEWQVPKVMQILREAEEIYHATDYIIEASDWIVWALTGKLTKSECAAGYKGIWHKEEGYPSSDFFAALDPRMEHYVAEKLDYPMVSLGETAGTLTAEMAKITGLQEGTPVAAGNVDAHVTMPALAIDQNASMLAIIGTSTCHILTSSTEHAVPGMCGVVMGGIYPGLYGYEAGQSCVGDHFAWFVDRCVPTDYTLQAQAEGKNMHVFLRERAESLAVGESGLVALDWWNGNRSVLVDVDLTGLMVGMTLQTRPEEMYRALIEATAFGTRKIIETFRESGVPVEHFYASGGISQKDSMTMQIYADVIGMPISIGGSTQGPALGSAIFGAVAAGSQHGGYDDITVAAKHIGSLREKVYTPIPENQRAYDALYTEYSTLHDYFGRGTNDVMKRLKAMRAQAKGE